MVTILVFIISTSGSRNIPVESVHLQASYCQMNTLSQEPLLPEIKHTYKIQDGLRISFQQPTLYYSFISQPNFITCTKTKITAFPSLINA